VGKGGRNKHAGMQCRNAEGEITSRLESFSCKLSMEVHDHMLMRVLSEENDKIRRELYVWDG
jgi:hypothetical protein